MYANAFDRKFGIEFEFSCNLPGYNRYQRQYDQNGNALRRSKYDVFRDILEDNGLIDWAVGADGSEYEVKTPPLSGPTGFKKVKRFLELVADMNGRVSMESDGLHVHHDAPEFIIERSNDPYDRTFIANKPLVERLVENWIANQNQIFEMVRYNRWNGWACPSWSEYDLATLKQDHGNDLYGFGRKNLNISALSKHGTIEIRLHEGSLNYEAVLSWVRFGQAFIQSAIDSSDGILGPSRSAEEVLRKVRVSRNANRFLVRKAAGYVSA